MVNSNLLREIVGSRHEWLLVRADGRSFPLEKHEIDIIENDEKTYFAFLDESGFRSWRLNSFTSQADTIEIDVAGSFSRNREILRLVPRVRASVLASEIAIARLKKANEIAGLISENVPTARLGRVALNEPNGRFAQITFERADKTPIAAIADTTGALSVESILAAAMLWLEKLGLRKRPVLDLWLVCEKRQARNAQKLHALLADRWKAKLSIVEIDRKQDPPRLVELAKRRISELWREKPGKMRLYLNQPPSGTAERITLLSPQTIDIVYSRRGETLRIKGLPFARVRTIMGQEKAWFGVGRESRVLTTNNWKDLVKYVEEIERNRTDEPPNSRHEFYRIASEAWLESILRRNISLLDANLVLSPIYNQFRSSNDKIDLLALRRDGRLVIIELKTQPDREIVFQAVDYWRKIELQRRRGVLAAADLFEGRTIADKPAIVYMAAPAWSFHREFEYFARSVSSQIEMWRFELHENWRKSVKVIARHNYSGRSD